MFKQLPGSYPVQLKQQALFSSRRCLRFAREMTGQNDREQRKFLNKSVKIGLILCWFRKKTVSEVALFQDGCGVWLRCSRDFRLFWLIPFSDAQVTPAEEHGKRAASARRCAKAMMQPEISLAGAANLPSRRIM